MVEPSLQLQAANTFKFSLLFLNFSLNDYVIILLLVQLSSVIVTKYSLSLLLFQMNKWWLIFSVVVALLHFLSYMDEMLFY